MGYIAWTMARAALVAILLIQCCNVVLGARLLEGGGAWLQQGIVQVLAKGGGQASQRLHQQPQTRARRAMPLIKLAAPAASSATISIYAWRICSY